MITSRLLHEAEYATGNCIGVTGQSRYANRNRRSAIVVMVNAQADAPSGTLIESTQSPMPEFNTGHHTPDSYQDHKSENSTHYPHLASIAASFFKAYYYQEPDPTNSSLNIRGYGGLVHFRKGNPAHGWAS